MNRRESKFAPTLETMGLQINLLPFQGKDNLLNARLLFLAN